MKHKKALTLFAVAIICVVCVGSMTACVKKVDTFTTDYFFCIYNEDKTEVRILELTDLGKEQEVLVIPKTINDVPVTKIGGDTKHWGHYTIVSDKLKKIYIYGDYFIYTSYQKCLSINEVVVIQPLGIEPYCYYAFEETGANIYFPYDYLISDFYKSLPTMIQCENRILSETIAFYVDNILFFADVYSEEDLYILPENPQKKDFEFIGWFDENNIQWNGEYPQNPEEQLRLYAKWM